MLVLACSASAGRPAGFTGLLVSPGPYPAAGQALAGRALYVLSGEAVEALDLSARPPRRLWRVTGAQAGPEPEIRAAPGLVLILGEGRTIALDARTGARRWQLETRLLHTVRRLGLAESPEGGIAGVDLASGRTLWVYPDSGAIQLDPSGTPVWPVRLLTVRDTPAPDGPCRVTPAYELVDPESGTVAARHPVSTGTCGFAAMYTPLELPGALTVIRRQHGTWLERLDPSTLRPLWTANQPSAANAARVATCGAMFCLTRSDREGRERLVVLDGGTGAERWSGSWRTTLVTAGGALFRPPGRAGGAMLLDRAGQPRRDLGGWLPLAALPGGRLVVQDQGEGGWAGLLDPGTGSIRPLARLGVPVGGCQATAAHLSCFDDQDRLHVWALGRTAG